MPQSCTARRGRFQGVAMGLRAVVLLILVAVRIAVVPVSWEWDSRKHTLFLLAPEKAPERFSGSPYKDPELVVGQWSLKVVITPKIGIGQRW